MNHQQNRNPLSRNVAPYSRHLPQNHTPLNHSHPRPSQSRWSNPHAHAHAHAHPHAHQNFTKDFRQCYAQGEKAADCIPKQSTPARQSPNLGHVTPPLRNQVPDPTSLPLLSVSPPMPSHLVDMAARSSRRSPIQLQHSPQYFSNLYVQDEGRKSQSPPRKRRRLSHHQIHELNVTPPPLPPRNNNWDRRNIRHPTSNRNRLSPLLRRTHRYQMGAGHVRPHPYLSNSPPHQPPVMLDMSQVPVSLPISLYANSNQPGHYQMHNLYPCPPAPHLTPSYHQIPDLMSTPHYPHSSPYSHSYLPQSPTLDLDLATPPHAHAGFHHSAAALVQVSPPSIFISEARPSTIEITRVRHHSVSNRRGNALRRWRGQTLAPTNHPYPGLIHLLAMFSNAPLSPYSQAELGSPDSTETVENYEALLTLAERLGEAKARGLNRFEIDSIPSFKFNARKHQSEQTSCVVCMCDFESSQVLRGLPCSHEFHARCVDKWLKSNRTCPICRGDAAIFPDSP